MNCQYQSMLRRRIFIVFLLLTPFLAHANPVIIDGASLISFWYVALGALLIEASVVSLLLFFSGTLLLHMFIAFFITNAAVFGFMFLPLLWHETLPLPVLELLVVCVDATAIKFLANLDTLQSGEFRGVSWVRAILISVAGNAVSYFVGQIASGTPWVVRSVVD